MKRQYDDIIHLPHHASKTHPHMTVMNRAAQFSPFAALTGYEVAVKEAARLTEKRIELDEYMKDLINRRLQIVAYQLEEHPEIAITYFQPDLNKDGGAYVTEVNRVKRIDEYKRLVLMTDGTRIPIDEIIRIDGEGF